MHVCLTSWARARGRTNRPLPEGQKARLPKKGGLVRAAQSSAALIRFQTQSPPSLVGACPPNRWVILLCIFNQSNRFSSRVRPPFSCSVWSFEIYLVLNIFSKASTPYAYRGEASASIGRRTTIQSLFCKRDHRRFSSALVRDAERISLNYSTSSFRYPCLVTT